MVSFPREGHDKLRVASKVESRRSKELVDKRFVLPENFIVFDHWHRHSWESPYLPVNLRYIINTADMSSQTLPPFTDRTNQH